MANLHRPSAHLYDLDPREITRDDIPFYRRKAREIDGPILELGCGTGRVTLPLIEDGHRVWALDLSQEMLNQLQTKLDRLPSALKSNVTICHADMADFRLAQRFDLIIAPFRAFQALTDPRDREQCLACIKAHLSARGRFVIHVFRPRHVFDDTWVQPEAFDWEVVDPRTAKRIRRYEVRKRIDLERQVLHVDLIYRIEGADDDIVEPLALSYFYEEQMRAMLQMSGFRIVEEYGYFDERPIANGPELIFVVCI
jgi:SAM-dependent methyltransferase